MIWMLSEAYDFEDDGLATAIAATFARRKTGIPVELPDALSSAFAEDQAKQQQWASFAASIEQESGPKLNVIINDLAAFLMQRARKLRFQS